MRETYKIIMKPNAEEKIKKNQCPICGKPKIEWNRRTDWRCCSKECTEKFNNEMITYTWAEFRIKVFERDGWRCVKCKKGGSSDKLIADHITSIALGGDLWNIDNIQTLCVECNKEKTRKDLRMIVDVRQEKKEEDKIQATKTKHKNLLMP